MRHDERAPLLRTGLFLMASIAFLLAAVILLGRSQTLFAHRARLHTSFQNTSGLVVGAPVRLAGVDIGIVDAIRFDADLSHKDVRVTLAVDRRYLDRIRADSIARLSSKGLLGDMLVNISVGSLEAPPLRDGERLRSQESEGLTEIMRSLDDGIGQLRSLSRDVQERLDAVLTDQLGRDLGRIAHATADVAEQVERGRGLAHAVVYDPQLGRAAAGTLDETQRAAASAAAALARLDRIVAAVESGDGTLHGIIYGHDGARLVAELERSVGELEQVIGAVKSGRGLLHALVYDEDAGQLVGNLTALARTLRRVGDDVRAGKGTVGALLVDPSLYEDLKTILGNVKRNRLLKALIRYTIQKDGLSAP